MNDRDKKRLECLSLETKQACRNDCAWENDLCLPLPHERNSVGFQKAMQDALYDNEQVRLGTVAASSWNEFPMKMSSEQKQQLRDCARRRKEKHIIVAITHRKHRTRLLIIYLTDLFPFSITYGPRMWSGTKEMVRESRAVDPHSEFYLYMFCCYLMTVGDTTAMITCVDPVRHTAVRKHGTWTVEGQIAGHKRVFTEVDGARIEKWPSLVTSEPTVKQLALMNRIERALKDLDVLQKERTPASLSREVIRRLASEDKIIDRIVCAIDTLSRYERGILEEMGVNKTVDMGKLTEYAARTRDVHTVRRKFLEKYMPIVHNDGAAIDILSTLLANGHASEVIICVDEPLLLNLRKAVFIYTPLGETAAPAIRYPDLNGAFDELQAFLTTT